MQPSLHISYGAQQPVSMWAVRAMVAGPGNRALLASLHRELKDVNIFGVVEGAVSVLCEQRAEPVADILVAQNAALDSRQLRSALQTQIREIRLCDVLARRKQCADLAPLQRLHGRCRSHSALLLAVPSQLSNVLVADEVVLQKYLLNEIHHCAQ